MLEDKFTSLTSGGVKTGLNVKILQVIGNM